MKKFLAISIVLSSVLTATAVMAQTAATGNTAPGAPAAIGNSNPTAPDVVAPAQPAGQAVINNSATTATGTGGQATATPPQQPSMLGMATPFLIMLGIMYFLMIRPQQKRLKEHQTLLSGLKSGDEVVTTSGILGTITGMSDKVVTLEVSKNVQLKVLKSQVNQIVKGSIQDIQAP